MLEAEVAGLHSGADVNVSPLEFAYSEYLSIGILMNFIILVQICGNKAYILERAVKLENGCKYISILTC